MVRWIAALAVALALVGAGAACGPARAGAPWPARPVTIITGYQVGSGVDTVARFLAESLRQRTGTPFIVENKPGAIGNIAAELVARAAPDGYTALFVPNARWQSTLICSRACRSTR